MAKRPFFHHFGCLRAALAACGPPGGPHMWEECILEAPCNRGQAHGPLDSCWVSKNSQKWAKTAKNSPPHTVWGAQQRHVWLLVGQTTTTHSFFETILIGVGIDEHLRSFWALGLAKNAQKCPQKPFSHQFANPTATPATCVAPRGPSKWHTSIF